MTMAASVLTQRASPKLTLLLSSIPYQSRTNQHILKSKAQIANMDHQEKEQVAQEKYGKNFEQLSTNEQKGVGGVHGGKIGGKIGGTVNKSPEEREQGVVRHEPQNQ